MSFSSRTIVCEEVFDENSAPLEEEVKEYACRIGIDPDSEPHLLHYARDGLMQALPAQWKPCFDKNVQAWYYFNTATRQSQWEHPLDGVYRSLVKKARSESISSAGEDDSKTSAKEELKSYEEPADPSGDVTSKTMDSSKSMSLRKANIQLNPLKKFSPTEPVLSPTAGSRWGRLPPGPSRDDASAPPRVDLTVEVSTAALFKAELRPKKEIPSPTARIDIDKMTVVGPPRQDAGARRDKLQSAQEKHPRGMTGRGELTLTGGGSIFLKSRDRPELQSPGQAPAPTPAEPGIEVVCSQDGSDMPKGILRDQKSAPARPLWDVDPHLMSAEEKQMWRRQELEEERKSVRFNLDKALDIHFTVSESDHSDQEAADEVGDEDWISDDEDLAKGRVTSGARAAVPVRDASDGSDRDEMSPKIIDSIFPSDDHIDTQMSRERPGKEKAGSLFHKVGGAVGSKGASKLTELYFPKEGMKNKVALNIFDEASHLSDESVVDRGREGSDSGVGRLTYEDTPGGEGGDSGAKAGTDGPQCAGKDPNQEEALLSRKEKMAQDLSESLKQLEMEHERRREATRTELALREQEDKQQRLARMEQRLALFRSSVQTQQEARETSLREKMEAACESVRAELATDHQRQTERLRCEYEQRLGQERAALEEQLAEMERELASKREALVRERTAVDEQLAEMERELASKREALVRERAAVEEQLAEVEQELASRRDALDRERAELEAVSAEQLRAASRRLEEESADRLAEARGQLEAARQARLQEMGAALAADLEARRAELAAAHQQGLEDLRASHEAAARELRQEHAASLESLRSQLHQEMGLEVGTVSQEEGVRRELEDQRARLARELEAERARSRTAELIDNAQQDQLDNSRMFEKLRCEKRLLEDKYRSLKEKYIRLKTDVKISIERRKKRDGGATTGSETDRSTSHKTGRSSEAERLACDTGRGRVDSDRRAKKHSPDGLVVIDNNNGAATGTDDRQLSIAPEPKNLHGQLSPEAPAGDSDNKSSTSSNHEVTPPKSRGSGDGNANNRRRRQLFGRPRPCSAANRPGIINNSNNTNNNNGGSVDDLEEGYSPLLSPVENLRRQLQKLEDLEDQFPASTHTDTYLRYPFTDTGQFGSSEMEFFRHRIHLERDSVRRAKDFLRVQRGNFLSRQRELKEHQPRGGTAARNMLDRLYQEEKELTDMEVSLHRTRGLLGEKIIRLRHLEQSLYRAAEQACPGQRGSEDQPLSDLSSHSGSSGFSSTELGTDADRVPLPHEDHYQESTEIIQSLENLNSEIREIWEVLHKQQEGASVKPAVVTCGDLAWPTLLVATPTLSERVSALRQQAQQNLAAMGRFPPAERPNTDHALAERARSLREWLRHARLHSAQL